METSQPVDYSIVVPVYFNEGSLAPTMEALVEQVISANPDLRGEVIFVDDGSGDGSLDELLRIKAHYGEAVKVVKLTRNFGQVAALQAGFRQARGACAVCLSADGQDPPELINRMLKEFRAGHEIVVATREDREESRFRVVTSGIFYRLMRRLSFPDMPAGGFDFFLIGRRPLEALLDSREASPFLQGQILWTGYPVKLLHYTRRQRQVGRSRWSFGRKLTYLLDGVMGYSFVPIRLMSLAGGVVALSGFLYAVVVFFNRLLLGSPVPGFAPLMIVLLVVSGLQLLMLGVMGEYLWRTLAQTRQRAPYLIDRIYD